MYNITVFGGPFDLTQYKINGAGDTLYIPLIEPICFWGAEKPFPIVEKIKVAKYRIREYKGDFIGIYEGEE